MLTSVLIYVSATVEKNTKTTVSIQNGGKYIFPSKNSKAKLAYSAEYSQATQFSIQRTLYLVLNFKSASTYNISTLFYCKLYFQLLAFLC